MSTLMTPTDYVALPTTTADARMRYGDGDQQFGDIYEPADGTADAIPLLLLHGGCWQHAFGLLPMGQMARAIADMGFLVCNLEYRRLGGGGGWPNTFLDVTAGLIQFVEMATGRGLDASRIVVTGHSAGGHLALWLASRWRLPTNSPLHNEAAPQPCAVVSLAGIGDLSAALEQGICRGAPGDLVGGSVAQHPDRHAQASPRSLLPSSVRQWHIVGREDVLVPADSVETYVRAAREAGDEVTLEVLSSSGHFEIVTAASDRWPEVRAVYAAALAHARR